MSKVAGFLKSLFSLRTSRPQNAFVLSRERLVFLTSGLPANKDASEKAVRSEAARRFAVASRRLPPEALRFGAGDAPFATPAFGSVLTALLAEVGIKVPSASLVVPDSFVRTVVVDVENAAAQPKETDEILKWKFGKLFGESVELRIAWQEAGGDRVVAIAAPEGPVASWEAAFAEAGIRIGVVEPASLAAAGLGKRLVSGNGLVVWAERESGLDEESVSTIFFKDGALRFLRTKAALDAEDAVQEIRAAASFVEAASGSSDASSLELLGPCAAGPDDSPTVRRFREFRLENGGPLPVSLASAIPLDSMTPLASMSGASGARLSLDTGVLAAFSALSGLD